MNAPSKERRRELTAKCVVFSETGPVYLRKLPGSPELLAAAEMEVAQAIRKAKAYRKLKKESNAPWWTVVGNDYYSSGFTLQAVSAAEAVGKVVIDTAKDQVLFRLKAVREATSLEVFVARLSAHNKAAGIPELWRVHKGKAQRGVQPKGYGVHWQDVPFLSTALLARGATQ